MRKLRIENVNGVSMQPTEIRAHLLMKGKTMAEFAKLHGTSKANIHHIVYGRTKTHKYRKAIAEFIGKKISEIWPDE